ncbi:MAG: hypothetical protein RIR70_759 [Pseudomonadota bacterium]
MRFACPLFGHAWVLLYRSAYALSKRLSLFARPCRGAIYQALAFAD